MIRMVLAIVATLAMSGPLMAAVEIKEVTSPGGIKAWLVEEHSIPFTALEIRFKGGASLDRDGARGAINLMTATLEEGAGDLDAQGFTAARDASSRNTYTAPALAASWLNCSPLIVAVALSSSGAPAASVLPVSATLLPKESPAPVLDALM